jgi:hypothetical protein
MVRGLQLKKVSTPAGLRLALSRNMKVGSKKNTKLVRDMPAFPLPAIFLFMIASQDKANSFAPR